MHRNKEEMWIWKGDENGVSTIKTIYKKLT